jgi:predicted nucleic acid-binding protein
MAEKSKSISHYIIDASYVLAFLLPDERTAKVEREFERFANGADSFYSSPILPFEVFNGLSVAVMRKRLKPDAAIDMVKTFLEWDIHYEPLTFSSVFALALKKHLTVYDASYAWLAREKSMSILTFDKDLLKIV